MPGTRNAFAERTSGASYLDVRVGRTYAERYGLRVEVPPFALWKVRGLSPAVSPCLRSGARMLDRRAGPVRSKPVGLWRGVSPERQEASAARFIIWGDQWLRSSTSSRPFEV